MRRQAGDGRGIVPRLGCVLVLVTIAARGTAGAADTFDPATWRSPPASARPYMRWWWPGGAIDLGEAQRELAVLRDRGFGGVEVQPFAIGLSDAEAAADPAVHTVGTPAFFATLRAVVAAARGMGLGIDVTLGSAWPFASPAVPRPATGHQLLLASVDVLGPARFDGPLPVPGQPAFWALLKTILPVLGDYDPALTLVSVSAAPLLDAAADPVRVGDLVDLQHHVRRGRLRWDVPPGPHRIFAVYENRSSQVAFGSAYPGRGADAFVIDHLDRAGFEGFRALFAEPMRMALGGDQPDAVFVDSFELVGELPWTPRFLGHFRRLLRYDPRPGLPLLFRTLGESFYLAQVFASPLRYAGPDARAERVGEDYEAVRGRLFQREFLSPLRRWTRRHGLPLRLQAHGGWGDVLDDYAVADIPESEHLASGGRFEFMKLAASAAHVAGRPRVSCESFVLRTGDVRPLGIEDFHRLAGWTLAAGVNRIIDHGYTYRYARSGGVPWYPWDMRQWTPPLPLAITSRLDEMHPVWPDLPQLNLELARLSYAMALGQHRADVAWLLNASSISGPDAATADPAPLESDTSRAIRQAGFVYDRVSRRALIGARVRAGRLRVGKASYGLLLADQLGVAPPELVAAIDRIARAGVPVVVLGALPARAPGFARARQHDRLVRRRSLALARHAARVQDPAELPSALSRAGLRPPLRRVDGRALTLVPEHRVLADGDLLLLFNPSDAGVTEALELGVGGGDVGLLDPRLEVMAPLPAEPSGRLTVTVPAHRSVVLYVRRNSDAHPDL